MIKSSIVRTLERLNHNYGWGEVESVRGYLDGRIEVDITSRYRKGRTYTARSRGRYRGHGRRFRGVRYRR